MIEILSQGAVQHILVEIGPWNMDSTSSVNVTLPKMAYQIVGIEVNIIKDDHTLWSPLLLCDFGGVINGRWFLVPNYTLTLQRFTGGTYDHPNWSNSTDSRGTILLHYIDYTY